MFDATEHIDNLEESVVSRHRLNNRPGNPLVDHVG